MFFSVVHFSLLLFFFFIVFFPLKQTNNWPMFGGQSDIYRWFVGFAMWNSWEKPKKLAWQKEVKRFPLQTSMIFNFYNDSLEPNTELSSTTFNSCAFLFVGILFQLSKNEFLCGEISSSYFSIFIPHLDWMSLLFALVGPFWSRKFLPQQPMSISSKCSFLARHKIYYN